MGILLKINNGMFILWASVLLTLPLSCAIGSLIRLDQELRRISEQLRDFPSHVDMKALLLELQAWSDTKKSLVISAWMYDLAYPEDARPTIHTFEELKRDYLRKNVGSEYQDAFQKKEKFTSEVKEFLTKAERPLSIIWERIQGAREIRFKLRQPIR
jgi:hypothetical protein